MNATLEGTFGVSGQIYNSELSQTAEGYEVLSFVLPTASTDVEVAVQPSDVAKLKFLAIKSSAYHATLLSYKVNANTNPAVLLTNMQVFSSKPMVDLLGANPDSLFFTNTTGASVTISIMVGRDVFVA